MSTYSSLKSEEYVDAMAAISLTSSYRRTVQHEGSETETHVPSTINQRLADADAASLSAEIRTLSMHVRASNDLIMKTLERVDEDRKRSDEDRKRSDEKFEKMFGLLRSLIEK